MSTPTAPTAPAFRGRGAARAVRFSSLSVVGRQGTQIVFALVVARILGPESFGAVSAATLVVTLAALLLDQGLAAAIVQRRDLPEGAAGAAMTVNLAVGVVLAAAVTATAGALAAFFSSPALAGMLLLLGPGLLLKAAAIVPRSMLLRRLALERIAVVEIAAAVAGCTAGLAAAVAGAGPMAMVVMTLLTDAVVAACLLVAERGPLPNLRLTSFAPLARFGAQVFATNSIAYVSRNVDGVLIGRLLGPAPLAQYAMAYRVLVLPVQLIGQSVNRVMFPVLSRAQDDREELAAQTTRATALLAFLSVPPMVLVAVVAAPLVAVVLGPAWAPAAPVMAVLALAGARETVCYLTPVLLRACGETGIGLRFQLLSTAVQVVGIVAGLPFGILGVGVGYALGGVALTPLLLVLQRRVAGVAIRAQLAAAAPPLHASAWAAIAALAVCASVGAAGPVAQLGVAVPVYAGVLALVLRVVHPRAAGQALRRVGVVLGRAA